MSTPADEQVTVSSGNVFRDLGRPDPALLLFKAKLAAQVSASIERRGWTQTEAAEHLGVDQPRVSHLIRGRLSGFSVEALLGYLVRLDVRVNVTVADPVGQKQDNILLTV
ncbi:MAG: helix-turn-helix domain-containing protein [Chloroflexota bacterium]|nr:helix-turn-helix domain-containing protein [Chloroflexota bacterium]